MKYAVLLGDGMADDPLEELHGKTPLEHANTPHMDRIAAEGTLGLLNTIPDGFTPGSDVANLSVLGYDPGSCYAGRGPLEAANMGVTLDAADVAFRCNLVTLADNENPVMEDFTAGHITSEEARRIILTLKDTLDNTDIKFYPGVSYRHLLVWHRGFEKMQTIPPHDIIGRPIKDYMPSGQGAKTLLDIMTASREILTGHPVNQKRSLEGKNIANSIWLWGQGRAPKIEKLTEKYHISGGMISAVDLLNGIGIYAGLKIFRVPGATGYIDTNYEGKAAAALKVLDDHDFVFVHVEAPDEMGHEGNIEGKIQAIEDFDSKIVGPILSGLELRGDFRLLVLSDHPTPLKMRTHSADPPPFGALSSLKGENQARAYRYSEASARRNHLIVSPGHLLMNAFINDWRGFIVRSSG